MTIRSLISAASKYAVDNSPTIVSAVGVTGTLATAYLTGKATFKAAEIIQDHEVENSLREIKLPDLTNKDKAKLVWKCYIPPALAVTGTIACIVTANSINASRLAGMAAAYKLAENQYKEYEDKVKEKLGLQDEKRLRDEINVERVRANPPSDDIQVLATEDEQIFLEAYTGRYFRSKMHIIKMAEAKMNREVITETYVTLSDFYDELGLARTSESGEIGWNLENPCDLDFTSTIADGGTRAVIVMEYANRPTLIRDYARNSDDINYRGIH